MFALTPLKTDTIYIATPSEWGEDALSEAGGAAARALDERLAALEIDALFSAPAEAAKATLAPTAERTGLGITALPDLRDHRLSLQGNAPDDPLLESRFANRNQARPGGETFNAAATRIRHAILAISRRPVLAPVMMTPPGLLAALLSARDKSFGYAEYRALPEAGLWKLTHKSGTPREIASL